MCTTRWRQIIVALLFVLAAAPPAAAQYFGQNKVQYRTFDFKIIRTAHFDIYFYPDEMEAAQLASRLAERWHARLSRLFAHDLRGRQAIILYAASAHFRQTNAVEGLIGEGTGGLTEALKRRIVLPMSGSLADTDHVLGHELVHAFQFDMTGSDPREPFTGAPGIMDFPLWFVEGMAEYITLGPVDPQTAMWMRDAAIHEQLPHIRDLDDPKYFPYRWGHAFWAYIGAKYGDRAVASLVRSAANPRSDLRGLALQLGTDPDKLTEEWHNAIRRSAVAVASDQGPVVSAPRLVVSRETSGGRYNVGPRLSPNGKEIAYFSEGGRFAVDLFVADAATGKVLRKLSSAASDPHFDSLEFLNSAGAWSPDSRVLAVAATREGKPVIALIDARSGDVRRELKLPGLHDVLNPSFSPDGRAIVFSGNRGGLMDLYRVSLESGQLEQLTNDPFADLEPTFAPDGRTVVFVTERFSTNLERLEPGPLRLARLDTLTRDVRLISGFLSGKHLSPQVSADGGWVTFLADPDGISNLYRMPIDGGPVTRLSSFVTGIAGVTGSSPALSIAATTGELAFSVFEKNSHVIYVLEAKDTLQTVAPPANRRAALLPGRETPGGDVFQLLSDASRGLPAPGQTPEPEPYTRRLTLDFIDQPTFSGGVTDFGPQFTGSAGAFFSDMLGDQMMAMSVQAGGNLADFGGYFIYVNRRHRWNWAASVEAIPYTTGFLTLSQNQNNNGVLSEVIERQTSRGLFATAAFPFNRAVRFEAGGGARQVTFSRTFRDREFNPASGEIISRSETTVRIGDALYLAEPTAAIVYDTSIFGATGPILGARARFEIRQSFGSLGYSSFLVDVRRYFMPVKPFTLAIRGLHYGRYGRDGEHEQLAEMYAGHQELVHGYGLGSFELSDLRDCEGPAPGPNCDVFNNLRGSRIAVANIELRAPLVGLFKGEMDYGRVPIEVAGFFDAGLAWSADTRPAFLGGTRQVVRSAGVAARVNIFGFAILEVAASRPFDRRTNGWQWQVGLKQSF